MVQSNVCHNIVSTVGGPRRQYGELTVAEEDESSSSSSSSLDTIRAMRQQEEAHYRVENYFRRQDLVRNRQAKNGSPRSHADADAMDVDTIVETFELEPIDPECRFRMAEWCYQISDFCGYKRETVATALSCLDRFIASKDTDHELYTDRSQFQLASMVCFYSSVKIHEHEAMDSGLVAKLSRGAFEAREIEEMEESMLDSLGFMMNPPTALAFSKYLLDLIPEYIVNNEMRDVALELAKYQTEIAVSDVDLIDIKSSMIALAALINSFDNLNMTTAMQRLTLEILSTAVQVDCDDKFRDIRIRLYEGLAGDGGGNSRFCSSISPQAASPSGFSRLVPTTVYYEPSRPTRV